MIYLASDHAGYELKNQIVEYVKELGYAVTDMGPKEYDPEDDYPDFIIPAAEKVAEKKDNLGIIFGGSGQGEGLAANKVRGIRAVVYYGFEPTIVKLSKEHNNANVLSIGARFVSVKDAKRSVKLWLDTKFSNAVRHKRRLKKVSDYEQRAE